MEEKSMRKMMNKVAGSMKATAAKAVHLLKDKRGEKRAAWRAKHHLKGKKGKKGKASQYKQR